MQRDASVSRQTPYAALVKAIASPMLSVQGGSAMQKAGSRVTKAVVVEPAEAGGEFALIFSMSHVAADGHDYYRILNMLAGNAPVEALSAARVGASRDLEPATPVGGASRLR